MEMFARSNSFSVRSTLSFNAAVSRTRATGKSVACTIAISPVTAT